MPSALSWNILDDNYPSDFPNKLLPFNKQVPTVELYLQNKNFDFLSFCAYISDDVTLITNMLISLHYAVAFFDYEPKKPYSKFTFITGYNKGYVYNGRVLINKFEDNNPKTNIPFCDPTINTLCIRFNFKKGCSAIALERMFDDKGMCTLNFFKEVNHAESYMSKL